MEQNLENPSLEILPNQDQQKQQKQENRKRKIAIAILAFLFLITIALGFFALSKSVNNRQAVSQTNKSDQKSGWKTYTNSVLGVEFSYPESWGEPETYPYAITDAKLLMDDLNSKNQSISISFKDVSQAVNILLLNDLKTKYGYFPNGPSGDTSNMLTLSESGNICLYKITTDINNSSSKLSELSNECNNGIKKSVVEAIEDFSGAAFDPPVGKLYSYNLEGFAFKKNINSMFPYIFIQSSLKSLNQEKNQLSYKEFLSKTSNNIEESDFTTFVKSFKIIDISKKPKTKIELVSSDINNIGVVKSYYNSLADGDYRAVSAKLIGSTATESEFNISQSKIYDQVIKEMNQISTDKVEVFSDIQLQNQAPKLYREVFKVSDYKLEEILKESINGEVSVLGNMRVYASDRDLLSVVVLQKDGQEKIIDSVAHKPTDEWWSTFYSPYFSPNGNYIVYGITYYEGGNSNIYNVKRDTISKNIAEGKFNPKETLYYTCQFSEAYGPTEARIYTVPVFSIKADLLKLHPALSKYMEYDCSNDEKSHIETFEFSGTYDKSSTYSTTTKEVYRFDSETGDPLP